MAMKTNVQNRSTSDLAILGPDAQEILWEDPEQNFELSPSFKR